MDDELDRRRFLKGLCAGLAAGAVGLPTIDAESAQAPELLEKPIPSSGEAIPVVGMGTWQTFNVGSDTTLRNRRVEILKAFFGHGGGLIDSSPMYGSSQNVVGYCLEKLGTPDGLFSADKVWTSDGDTTRKSVSSSAGKWRIDQFDLMQVHNLVAWQDHLDTLQTMKEKGELSYVGVTTSHGRRHSELATILKNRDIDFVQLTYNLADREPENELLPLAKKNDIAVIANRPFRGGSLVDRFQNASHPLPDWASDWRISNWPQFLLKFIVSHPAVTCAIPATTQVEHMRENMGAARAPMPDPKTRTRMLEYVDSL